MENEPIVFELKVAKDKPQSYRAKKQKQACPFCDTEHLIDIYEQKRTWFGCTTSFLL